VIPPSLWREDHTDKSTAINAFLELGLPFIMRFANDWREGKTTIKEAMSKRHDEPPTTAGGDVEKRFLNKVERELGLPDYSLFSKLKTLLSR